MGWLVEGAELLGELRTRSMWLMYESRPGGILGPQRACHPDELELSVMLEGTELGRLGRREIEIGAGHYWLVAPGVEHASRTLSEGAVEVNVHIQSSVLEHAMEELGMTERLDALPPATFELTPEVARAVESLRRASLAREPLDPMTDSLAFYVAGCLLRVHGGPGHNRYSPLASRGLDRHLRRAVELMHARAAEGLTLEELATAAGMSRFRFAHVFKARFGASPYAYLTRVRVARARELLAGTELSVSAIAQAVGYGSSGRFSEAFKRVEGVSPNAWRRRQPRARFSARSVKPVARRSASSPR